MNDHPPINHTNTSYHNPPRQRERVLVLAYGDGWVEVYAEKHVDVRFEIAPHVTTSAGEIAAQQYLDEVLPVRYRELYWPGLRRAADMVRVIRPSDIEQRDWELRFLDVLDRVAGNSGQGGIRTWMV